MIPFGSFVQKQARRDTCREDEDTFLRWVLRGLLIFGAGIILFAIFVAVGTAQAQVFACIDVQCNIVEAKRCQNQESDYHWFDLARKKHLSVGAVPFFLSSREFAFGCFDEAGFLVDQSHCFELKKEYRWCDLSNGITYPSGTLLKENKVYVPRSRLLLCPK